MSQFSGMKFEIADQYVYFFGRLFRILKDYKINKVSGQDTKLN